MLSSIEIKNACYNNEIIITPFDESNLNPVSYDMEIDDELMIIKANSLLDTQDEELNNKFKKNIIIPETGLLLEPGNIYLAKTKERVCSNKYIPCVTGRSSFARLGIQVHQTAFFANPGHDFNWILEISVIVPVIIHRGDKICQMYFEKIDGELKDLYCGKYSDNNIKL